MSEAEERGDDASAFGAMADPTAAAVVRPGVAVPARAKFSLEPGATHASAAGVRYEIVRRLGPPGGQGKVVLARQRKVSGLVCEVALKYVAPAWEEDETARRLLREEAELQKKLRHSNIVRVDDLETIEGRDFLVLEYVDGVSLWEVIGLARLKGKRLSEGLACYIVATVAEALFYAHGMSEDGKQLGIVHRDVKPANVMVSRSGVVMLLDFGIAYSEAAGRERTSTGVVKGTIPYYSPEQAADEHVDSRSDLFSLGLVLVELLTGDRPFDRGGRIRATTSAIEECSPAEVKAVTRALPRGLQEICRRALTRRPEDRFQTGREFARALESYLQATEALYRAGELTAELQELGAFSPGAVAEIEAACPRAGSSGAGVAPRSSSSRWWVMAAILACGIAIVGAAAAWRWNPRHGLPEVRVEAALKPAEPASATPEAKATNSSETPAAPPLSPTAAEPGAPAAPPPVATVVAVETPVLHPKRTRKKPKSDQLSPLVATPPEGKEEPTEPVAEPKPAMARVEEGPVASLPRGTLIPVRTVGPLDPARPVSFEGVVMEDRSVSAAELASGSPVHCYSRPAQEGRVPVFCDRLRSGGTVYTFSGIAVGESGEALGLRIVNRVGVPAGTAFVVYVRGPAE